MATSTPRLGLLKPALTESADIAVINSNMDILDSKYSLRADYATNLLDNSDFRAPINQRGVTSGSPTSQTYMLDRWKAVGTYTLTSLGLVLSAGAELRQHVALPNGINPNNVQFWYGMADGTVAKGSFWPTSETRSYCVALIPAVKAETTVQWAALYEGSYTADTLPVYHPKGYMAELAECQRYYYRIGTTETYSTLGMGMAHGGDNAIIITALPAMRIKIPTLAYGGAMRLRCKGDNIVPSGIELNQCGSGLARLYVHAAIAAYEGCALELQSNGDASAYLAFSADL